jgi:hypothetical protein
MVLGTAGPAGAKAEKMDPEWLTTFADMKNWTRFPHTQWPHLDAQNLTNALVTILHNLSGPDVYLLQT